MLLHALKEIPPALKIELKSLCDTDFLWTRQQRYLKAQLQKLEQRLSAGNERLIATYQLSSEIPLEELLNRFSPEDREWEIGEGGRLRKDLLWTPTHELLTAQMRVLESLRGDS